MSTKARAYQTLIKAGEQGYPDNLLAAAQVLALLALVEAVEALANGGQK